MSNIFGSLSAVLFLICFIMGAGLIQSDDKIDELEKRLVKLDDSYRYILSQIKDDNVQSVFAQNSSKYSEPSSEQTSSLSTANTHTTQQTTVLTTETSTVSTTKITDKTSETTSKSTSKSQQNLKKYEVKEGDSLELISKKFYGDRSKIEEIMSINGLDNPNTIYVGKTLLLP